MSTNNADDKSEIIQTDAESQETGALHGQTPTGEETGSSAPGDPGSASQPSTPERDAEGTGAAAGEYS